ncbi:uncharacterized protein LOC126377449 [Pectinophora gossypiella]|uniref:uncharacterized protein LOC126377449 n=1 Tax=Pectinophora gossypiella TaxID=13191 RepID=UPI00214F43E4|nr:uncharacterized protein LOC126377449 [Pectinophora gossypiella]
MDDWWRNVDLGGSGSVEWCAAARMWRGAWAELAAVTAPPPVMPPPPPPPPRPRSPPRERSGRGSASPDSTSPGDPLPGAPPPPPVRHTPPRPPSPSGVDSTEVDLGASETPDSSGSPVSPAPSSPSPSSPAPSSPIAAARRARAQRPTLTAEEAWHCLVEASPPDTVWHSLRNCVAYQAGVWQRLCAAGMQAVSRPAAFRLAIVLRHTRTDLAVRLLAQVLQRHPDARAVSAYVLTLITDDEAAWCGSCNTSNGRRKKLQLARAAARARQRGGDIARDGATSDGATSEDGATSGDGTTTEEDSEESSGASSSPSPPPSPPPEEGPAAPPRELRLFGDCELAVLAARKEEYDAHAKLVRAEYSKLTHDNYVELRIKVLQQFSQIPRLYHSAEFAGLEAAARENIAREVATLKDHLPMHRCRIDQ